MVIKIRKGVTKNVTPLSVIAVYECNKDIYFFRQLIMCLGEK